MILKLIFILFILVLLIVSISRWKIHPFIALLLSSIFLGLLVGLEDPGVITVLLDGFSSTLKWIAIVIILGAFIGEVLSETGGAIRISEKLLKLVGQKRLPWAMGLTGYLVSIPVFVDVAYILFHPITETLSRKSKTPVLTVGLALTAGLTVSHTLMPPTPGPLAVASMLEADLGRLILINAFVGLMAATGGVLWAQYFCSKFRLPIDDKPIDAQVAKQQEENAKPGALLIMDLLPIITPIVLMALGAFFEADETSLGSLLLFLSTPLVAVLVGAAIAMIQYVRVKKKTRLNELVESAIVKSALVIMITGAGGAFGYVIRATGIQESLGAYFAEVPQVGFILPFIVAAVLTSSTGSITVSLIGAASIIAPLAPSLPFSVEITAALIGCGSFCVFHANASFFWLLNRLHNVPVSVLYRTYTLQSLIMGLSGLAGVLLLLLFGVH